MEVIGGRNEYCRKLSRLLYIYDFRKITDFFFQLMKGAHIVCHELVIIQTTFLNIQKLAGISFHRQKVQMVQVSSNSRIGLR